MIDIAKGRELLAGIHSPLPWAGVIVILAVWGWLHFTGWPVTDEEYGLALYNCSQPDVEEQFLDCSAELSDAKDAGRLEAREWAEKWGTESD